MTSKLHTKAGEVTLTMPKLRRQSFRAAIIERYGRRETSIEAAPIEMYLAGWYAGVMAYRGWEGAPPAHGGQQLRKVRNAGLVARVPGKPTLAGAVAAAKKAARKAGTQRAGGKGPGDQ